MSGQFFKSTRPDHFSRVAVEESATRSGPVVAQRLRTRTLARARRRSHQWVPRAALLLLALLLTSCKPLVIGKLGDSILFLMSDELDAAALRELLATWDSAVGEKSK